MRGRKADYTAAQQLRDQGKPMDLISEFTGLSISAIYQNTRPTPQKDQQRRLPPCTAQIDPDHTRTIERQAFGCRIMIPVRGAAFLDLMIEAATRFRQERIRTARAKAAQAKASRGTPLLPVAPEKTGAGPDCPGSAPLLMTPHNATEIKGAAT